MLVPNAAQAYSFSVYIIPLEHLASSAFAFAGCTFGMSILCLDPITPDTFSAGKEKSVFVCNLSQPNF